MENSQTGNAEDATLRLGGATGGQQTGREKAIEADLFSPGNLFLGKYNIQNRIGVGGMGVVYRCSQVFIGKDLAIKTLNQRSMNDDAVQRFQTEAKAAGALNHQNIVSVHDFGVTDGGTPYMVMDFVPGKTLHDVLCEKGQLSLDQVLDIFIQCADALAHAHGKGVLHRDIKPSNIVLLQEENIGPGLIRILDFGIAKITSNSAQTQELTKTGMVIGSPLYMSPEQSIGKKMDARTDIYSLACVMFECLCGAPPFQGETIIETLMLHQTEKPKPLREASMGREFPARLQELVDSMMAKNVEDRVDSMSSVYSALMDIKDKHKKVSEEKNALNEKAQIKEALRVRCKKLLTRIGFALVSTRAIIALITLTVFVLAAYVVMQIAPQAKLQNVKPMEILDGRFSTPEIERASYDQKVRKVLTESRSRGWEHASIPVCEFSQSQFDLLASTKWLKKLTLRECSRFTPQGIKTILSGNIEYLDLYDSELDDSCVEAIAKYGDKLRSLGLGRCGNVSQKALLPLIRLKNLESLDLRALPVSDKTLKVIVDGLPKLRELTLANNVLISDNSARILARHKAKWGFDLSHTSVSDEGFKSFGKNVVFLYLISNPRITDKGIETLAANCPDLCVLQIPGTSVTPTGIFKALQMKNMKDLQLGRMSIDAATRNKVREVAKARKINIYGF